MSKFCERPDGRAELVRKIRDRLKYHESFEGLYDRCVEFHRALRPLHFIDTVITTNWDVYFEKEADYEPFVFDADMAFWDIAQRKVLKIHGSITNFGSIVATDADYKISLDRLRIGPIGAQLKAIMSTKTIIYIGYSLRDENFRQIFTDLKDMMGAMMPHCYFVSPYLPADTESSIFSSMTFIKTDGAYFLSQLREIFSETFRITRDIAFERCNKMLLVTYKAHKRVANAFAKKPNAALFYSLAYQDGLIDALERITHRRTKGEYYHLCRVQRLCQSYGQIVKSRCKAADYWDASYAQGYQNGMLLILAGSEEELQAWPPLVDIPHRCFSEIREFKDIANFDNKKAPKKVLNRFDAYMNQIGEGKIMIPEHTHFLNL